MITCAYIVYDWNSVQVRQSRALHIFNIYVCTDVSSFCFLANVFYLYVGYSFLFLQYIKSIKEL